MDLATLLKKVRQQSYRTKKAFSEDLDLIWSNCLLYNSHPVSEYPLPAVEENELTSDSACNRIILYGSTLKL